MSLQSGLDSQHTEEIISLLIRRQAELNSLLEISQAINRNYTESTIFQMFEFVLKMHLKVGSLRMFICRDDIWNAAATYGLSRISPKQQYNLCKKLKNYTEVTFLEESTDAELKEYALLIPVFYSEEQTAYVLLGKYIINENVNADASFIQTIINVIMVAIENKRLFKERLAQERFQKEIELAGQVQSMLFPRDLPGNNRIDIDSVYLPHHSIGGDYYDYFELSKNDFMFCIADVTGKGIAAALLMANFQANLRALAKQSTSLVHLVTELNAVLFNSTKGEKFITLFVGLLNTETRVLNYINAGHHAPFVIKDETVNCLESGTTVIGVFDELPFINPGSIVLEPNSLIFCYTDGLVEFEEENYLMDIDGLRDFVVENQNLRVAELNKKLIKHVRNKMNVEQFEDDITLLTFKCK